MMFVQKEMRDKYHTERTLLQKQKDMTEDYLYSDP